MEAYQWGPGTEKLLESLRQYSSELLESLNRSADSIERLSRASMQARIAVDNIKNRFELLSLNHSVTQKVQDTSHLFLALERRSPRGPEHAGSAVRGSQSKEELLGKYMEALRLAAGAVTAPLDAERYNRPLPYLYGSPEYLQHEDMGLSLSGASSTAIPPMTTQDLLDRAYSGLPGSFRTSGSLQEAASTPGSQEAPRDFMAMLDLALRGQLGSDVEGQAAAPLPQEATSTTASSSAGLGGGRANDAGEKQHPRVGGHGVEPLKSGEQAAGLPDLAFDEEGLFDDDDEDEVEREGGPA